MLCTYCGKKEVHTKGLCGCCYARYLKNGSPERIKVKKLRSCINCGIITDRITKNYCQKCYARYLKYGEPIVKRKRKENQSCSFCGKVDYLLNGLCRTCYQRQRKNGTPEYIKVTKECQIDGCYGISEAKNLCKKHYARYRRFVVSDEYFKQAIYLSNKKRTQNKRFKLSMEEYNKILLNQNGGCAICGNAETITHKKTKKPILLSIDHCHNTMGIRGLLCSKCNIGIGCFKDSVELLQKAIDYLKSFKG